MTPTRRAAGIRAALMVAALFGLAIVPARARTLSFEERVAAQKAIEQVYWSRRIWPTVNPGPKPTLAAVMPDEAIRAKVDDYLRKSNALERFWHRPITGGQLQAELNRMAASTQDAPTLRELYRALGDDEFAIAETLARQTLVDPLIRDWYSRDSRFHGGVKARAAAALSCCSSADCMKTMGETYQVTTWKRLADGAAPRDRTHGLSVPLQADEWADKLAGLAAQFGTGRDPLPIGRLSDLQETADAIVVTLVQSQNKGELVTATVTWPKRSFDDWWAAERGNLGTALEPAQRDFTTPALPEATCTNGTWTPTGGQPPAERTEHTAVWTGAEMIVWGGATSSSTGGRYNPATDSWLPVPPTNFWQHNRPAVWTGTEMIVWGGDSADTSSYGGRYNPQTNLWTQISVTNAPLPRSHHSAVWTGTEMIVWGGDNAQWEGTLDTGGRYNPSTDIWRSTSTGANHPSQRIWHTAVWTGTEMIVWGGADYTFGWISFNTGGRYDPTTDTWKSMSMGVGLPEARDRHTAVWTGSEMIVWGGGTADADANTNDVVIHNTGGRYNPATDTWSATTMGSDVPAPRLAHAAVWTGSEMIVWGGASSGEPYPWSDLATGGRYNPVTAVWTPTSTSPFVPSARSNHTAVWTGTEMIVWGGEGSGNVLNTGGRYCALPCAGACNDNNACTSDSCDPASGCVHAPVVCNDNNPCTDDSCSPASGCVFTPNTSPCDDGSLCTTNDVCTSGVCGGHSGINESHPRTVGYWKDLCKHSHSGDQLTDQDAQCVAASTASFETHTAANLCQVFLHHNGGDSADDDLYTWGDVNHPSTCDKARAELLALALNRCRGRVCDDQQIDPDCDASMLSVGQSFTTADNLISGNNPTSAACQSSRCLTRELDNGKALELHDMKCDRIDNPYNGAMRCHWSVPRYNDDSNPPSIYEIWRRSHGIGAFTLVTTVSSPEYYVEDPNDDYDYDVKPVR